LLTMYTSKDIEPRIKKKSICLEKLKQQSWIRNAYIA